MKNIVVRISLMATLLAGFAFPVFADGNPIPWPQIPTKPGQVKVVSPKLMADGNPIPWPGKSGLANGPRVERPAMLLADGNPIPWPQTPPKPGQVGEVASPKLIADGNPIPWPKGTARSTFIE